MRHMFYAEVLSELMKATAGMNMSLSDLLTIAKESTTFIGLLMPEKGFPRKKKLFQAFLFAYESRI